MFDELSSSLAGWVLTGYGDTYSVICNYLQEKAANALVVASNTIRWVTSPSGTVVTFPNDMGLPSIFDSKPCRYIIIILQVQTKLNALFDVCFKSLILLYIYFLFWVFGMFSYPPPRENCAGPSCTNPYKYRDSKWKLPLCSLQCYKAVREKNAG